MSREQCGCNCPDGLCEEDTCLCALESICCIVERLNFPCTCTSTSCKNPFGREEFDQEKVRQHQATVLSAHNPKKRRKNNNDDNNDNLLLRTVSNFTGNKIGSNVNSSPIGENERQKDKQTAPESPKPSISSPRKRPVSKSPSTRLVKSLNKFTLD